MGLRGPHAHPLFRQQPVPKVHVTHTLTSRIGRSKRGTGEIPVAQKLGLHGTKFQLPAFGHR
jgi:hypothetical protein